MLAVLVLIAVAAFYIIREKKEQAGTAARIEALKGEVAGLENDNTELLGMIKYFQSDDFVEREAREKFNYKKLGEKVVIIPDENGLSGVNYNQPGGRAKKNWQRWIEYFFGQARE